MPRHSYAQIKPIIEALCREHKIPHHTTGFAQGMIEVLSRLSEVGRAAQAVHAKLD
jgi:hypothetical protein